MTFPFHCMQTGIGSEATQGNTSRCRVSLDVGDAAMVAALRPQSPLRQGAGWMPDHALPSRRPALDCRASGACARSAEAADPSWGKRMPGGVVGMPKKRRHRPPGERNELPETAFPSCKWTCPKGEVSKVKRNQRREPPPRGFHRPASPRSRRCRPAPCGLVGFRDCCHRFEEPPNPSPSVFLAVRTGNDPLGCALLAG